MNCMLCCIFFFFDRYVIGCLTLGETGNVDTDALLKGEVNEVVV